jgi:hypothetical protein
MVGAPWKELNEAAWVTGRVLPGGTAWLQASTIAAPDTAAAARRPASPVLPTRLATATRES